MLEFLPTTLLLLSTMALNVTIPKLRAKDFRTITKQTYYMARTYVKLLVQMKYLQKCTLILVTFKT